MSEAEGAEAADSAAAERVSRGGATADPALRSSSAGRLARVATLVVGSVRRAGGSTAGAATRGFNVAAGAEEGLTAATLTPAAPVFPLGGARAAVAAGAAAAGRPGAVASTA